MNVIDGLRVVKRQNSAATDSFQKTRELILLVEGFGMDGCAGMTQHKEHRVTGPVRCLCHFLPHHVSKDFEENCIFKLFHLNDKMLSLVS